MKHALQATLVASALAVALGAGAQTGTITPQTEHPNRPPAGQSNASEQGARGASQATGQSDRAFAVQAAIAGLAEVETAKLAKKRASSDAIREMAEKMVDDHSRANDRLTSIAANQNITLPKAMEAAQQRDVDRLQKLSGQAFDRALLAHERQAHREAIALYSKQAESGSNAELKKFAADQLPKLREHLEQVEKLQRQSGGSGDK
jgi:putative membrane protein